MDFDVFQWNECQLYGIALGMCYSVMMPQLLDVDLVELLDFIVEVERNYQSSNPYHNFRHAMDVSYMVYHMLNRLNAVRFFVQLDLIVILLAAFCHDISHPGLNNLYQINSKTDLAVRYQDVSVLENYSVSQTLAILERNGLLRNLEDTDDAEYMRQSIKSIILSTDMVDHFVLLKDYALAVDKMLQEATTPVSKSSFEKFKRRISNTASIFSRGSSSSSIPQTEPSEYKIRLPLEERYRLTFMKVLLHAADISNPCRPWPICQKWADLVTEEFYLQGDCELRNQMPVSPNMDRRKADPLQTTLRFSDFIVKPFFSGVANFFQEMRCYCDQQSVNRAKWLEMEAERKAKKKQAQVALDVPVINIAATSSDSLTMDDAEPETTGTDIKINLLSPLQRPGIGGRRMSFAAGVIIIPDEIQTAEISKSSVFSGSKNILFEVTESSNDNRQASPLSSPQHGDQQQRSHLRLDRPAGLNTGSSFANLSRLASSNAVAGAPSQDGRISTNYMPRRRASIMTNHSNAAANSKLGMPTWASRSTDGRGLISITNPADFDVRDLNPKLSTSSDSRGSMESHSSFSATESSATGGTVGSGVGGVGGSTRAALVKRVSNRNVDIFVEASVREENEDPMEEEEAEVEAEVEAKQSPGKDER